ncbi:MAG: inositol monophosphatase [Acidimicrobiia bacterium]|nr:inositol monophosphatase [Acidimicrobiia bacterium]
MNDIERLSLAAQNAASAAAAFIRSQAGGSIAWDAKSQPGDYVTEVDRQAERIIREILHDAEPGMAFHGEESGGDSVSDGWLVDPLDGTTNFVHGFPAVGVAVALMDGGRPLLGVVAAPFLDALYVGIPGQGAWMNGTEVTVSDLAPERAICATGFPFKHPGRLNEYEQVFLRALRRFEDLRRPGAAALDAAWVGSGVFEGFFELGLSPWDIAAGAAIVRGAGGVVTDWGGEPDRWVISGDVVMGNPQTHEALLEVVAS